MTHCHVRSIVFFTAAVVAALCASHAASQEPALPPGLDEPDGPALPPGLDEPDVPALPPGLGDEVAADGETQADEREGLVDRLPWELHGFWEVRGGLRTQNDRAQPRDATLGEVRLQLETEKAWQSAVLEFTGDAYFDGVLEEAEFDLRRLRLTWSPLDTLDVRLGRQVLTWGTGDLLFINDLFPKDWQSFFIGRDVEYLKAPSDAVKIGWYPEWGNVEFVYTPQFEPDRYITGERISYFHPMFGLSGRRNRAHTNPPNDWFEDDEFALRVYRSVGRYEVAAYGYAGYWKSPAGMRLIPFQATFPKLNVYGASVRGPLGKGIFNAEVGYFDSRQDRHGNKMHIDNSQFRLLIGYEQELAKELTGSVQYYVEHMMGHHAYRNTPFSFMAQRDRDRHVVTARLAKLLMNQNLTVSLFAYYSPSDNDAYLRPHAKYKVNDHWTVEAGGNVFLGASNSTFFGQFEGNTNVYAAVRWSF